MSLLFISFSNKTKKKGLKNKIESKSDLKLGNINGNVKKYSIISYNADSSTNVIQSFWYNKDGNTTQNKKNNLWQNINGYAMILKEEVIHGELKMQIRVPNVDLKI